MLAAQIKNTREFEIIEAQIPEVQNNEVLVRVEACGICKSELYFWQKGLKRASKGPGFPGHEAYGVIEKAGPGVEHLKDGDLVTCVQFPGYGYAQYLAVHKNQVLKVPEGQKDHVVLGEPLACAVNAFRRFNVKSCDNIVLIGAGFMGSILLKLLKQNTSPGIIAIDKRQSARDRARELGSDFVLSNEDPGIKSTIHEMTGGKGADVVIEVTGTQEALDMATEVIGELGTLVIVGYHSSGKREIDMRKWNNKGLTIINAHERSIEKYMDGMRRAVSLLNNSKLSLNMISHHFKLDEINEGFRMMEETPEGYTKAVVYPWK
jgi:threonine dehydrogenase-like Zn-dependent dehydrogenase